MAAADKLTRLKHLRQLAEKVESDYALKTEIPSAVSELTNDSNFQTETQVNNAISAAVAGALRPAGSIAFASLPALTEANCNKIYNITDAFTTTSDFIEGSGKSYPAGTNVAIINTGTEQSPVYKYDTYTGTFDFSGFAEKVSGATSGNFAALDANGNLTDSGHKHSDYLTSHQDISGKADKDTEAVEGNFAAFDSSGNPVDSGHKHSDYITSHQDITGKADKVSSATSGNFAGLDSNGNLTDSGKSASDFSKVAVSTEGDGTLSIDGTSKTIVYIATDQEVSDMLDEVFGTTSNSGNE